MRNEAGLIVGTFPIDASIVHSQDDHPELIEALKPYDSKDYQTAVILLEPLVRAGNLLAIFKYANSLDWLDRSAEAEYFWRIAIAAGHMPSRNNLANNLKAEGRRDEAYELYLAAAEAGENDAMFNLGLLLEKTDWPAALRWFKQAVAAGHAKVCANLAIKFFADQDVETAMFYAQLGIQRQDGFSALAVALHHWKLDEAEKVVEYTDLALSFRDPLRANWIKNALPLRALALLSLDRLEEGRAAYQACVDADVEAESLANLMSLISAKESEPRAADNCHSCGSQAPSEAKFCTNCGQALRRNSN